MNTPTLHAQESQTSSVNEQGAQKQQNDTNPEFHDNRPEVLTQLKLKRLAQSGKEEQNVDISHAPIQKKPNNTGLPDNLKSGIEQLSGISMDDVKVHRNSEKPSQLQAHAYTQGTEIHVAPGQDKHLPHEAWHVVQQKQGRVQPTKQLGNDVKINDSNHLEREADVMGAKAVQMRRIENTESTVLEDESQEPHTATQLVSDHQVVQRQEDEEEQPGFFKKLWKGFKKHGTWMMLIAEGLGHWAVSAATALSAAGGAVWNIITSICQGAVGVSKMIRAYFVRVVAYNPLRSLPSFFNGLIAAEGGLGAISALAGGWGVFDKGKDVVVGVIPKISGFIGSMIKVYRGTHGARLTKKKKGALIVLESLFGLFGNIERIINAADKVFDGLTKTIAAGASKFVGAIKAGRGAKTYAEGAIATSETHTQEEEQVYIEHIIETEDLDGDTQTELERRLARLRGEGAQELHGIEAARDIARGRNLGGGNYDD